MVDVDNITSRAVVPDQLIPYVRAVSGLDSSLLGQCVLHQGGDQAVLVAFPLHNPLDKAAAEESLRLARNMPGFKHLSVLAPCELEGMENAKMDNYWQLPLPPPPPNVKLRNMLRRAQREIVVEQSKGADAWTAEHENLAMEFRQRKQETLDEGMHWLFSHLSQYLEQAEGALLFSARTEDGALAALAIGDFSPFATAFYMFACRKQNAPPGTADALLQAIATEASLRGHIRVNLGLGIDRGIEFFKRKWGAKPYLPLVEGTVAPRTPKKSGFWARILGG